MWIDKLTGSATLHAIELTARFAEQRHKLLAENVANIDTPDYHTKQLDADAFRQTLGSAMKEATSDGSRRLDLRHNAQVSTTRDGRLVTKPTDKPAQNVLFHDGGNASLETLMTDVQKNALEYEVATRLLRGKFESMLKAIKGRLV